MPDLDGIDDKQFAALVALDAHGQAPPEVGAFLREGDTVLRWRDELASLTADIQTQFTERRADVEAEIADIWADKGLGHAAKQQRIAEVNSEYKRWRAAASRFRGSVNDRLREARRLNRVYSENYRQLEGLVKDMATVLLDVDSDDEIESLFERLAVQMRYRTAAEAKAGLRDRAGLNHA